MNASATSKFLVAEDVHWAAIFRECAEAGADVGNLKDYVCLQGLGLSGFFLHSTSDFEIVVAFDRPQYLMTVDAVLYRLALAGVDVRTHFLSSPGIKRGGHTMVMVGEGPCRVSGEGGNGKWPCFATLTWLIGGYCLQEGSPV